ncbi:DNA repair protein rad16 [Apophysomyces ossiformis]|uniref:DNA repair protein rad16 n=1 Tax=Apophysomyces ossiformis TaxID=679940 RepID=A0A8H7ES85_9FUNG|nr:DNA repair protein rad16 [Apophysomyces ossiformis]
MVATRRSLRGTAESSSTPSGQSSTDNSRNGSKRASVCSDSDDDFQPQPTPLGRRRTRSSVRQDVARTKRQKGAAKSENEENGGAANLSSRSLFDRKGKGKAIGPYSPDTTGSTSGFDTIADTPETSVSGYSKTEDSDLDDEDADEADNASVAAENESETESGQASYNESDLDSSAEESDSSDEEAPTQTQRGRRSYHQQTSDLLLAQHKELRGVWEALKGADQVEVMPVEQPEKLSLPLLPFQKHGVGWMLQQEKLNEFKGGILADEMGMGKTIQTISLLLSDDQGPSLVIAPTVAIVQWKREIETHTNNALKICLFHGAKRPTNVKELLKHDVILSTYSVVESCFRRQEYGVKRDGEIIRQKSVLHKIHWHRIILDEAHNIKDRACNTARAVFNMNANYRWSLTGTPLQNRVGELYSLIRFMQAGEFDEMLDIDMLIYVDNTDPFGYYYCKRCPCKELSWKFSDRKGCDTCGHKPMDHVCWWNNEVLKPIQMRGHVGEGREAMGKLRLLLDKIMLRRTKLECADDLGLPPRTVVIRRDLFNEEEEDFYTSLFSDSVRKFSTYVEEGTVLNNYANIFELLTKMRQCANHPDLVIKKKDVSDNRQLVCMLCSETPEDAIAAACKHVFCRECCVQYYQSFDNEDGITEKPKCPTCFADFSIDLSQPSLELNLGHENNSSFSKSSIINRINMEKWRSSSKIEALVEELMKLQSEDKTIKSIVFSQFVNFLDLVYWRLSRMGFNCIRLDGTMSPLQRDAAINCFMTKPSVTVFLISLKAGGVALNLTEASRVFICDPWWNPAAERKLHPMLNAMDRIHRLGQHRPIKITRLIIENSIESRIVQLQEKKQALVESTIGKDKDALEKLTVEDLQFLFAM